MDTEKSQHMEIIPNRTGPHLFDGNSNLLACFYEVLFLSRVLGQTRGTHTRQPHIADAAAEARRNFLQNLCFICDFKKGGDSCTAIGLEKWTSKYQFWVSSDKKTAEIVKFLSKALEFLRVTSLQRGPKLGARESKFIELCTDFAKARIKEEQRMLQTQATICVSKLQKQKKKLADEFIQWLHELIGENDQIKLCEFTYKHRRSKWINELRSHASNEEFGQSPQDERSSFFLVRHYIGRLSHHIRAPSELVKDSTIMSHILQTHVVCRVESLPSVQLPSHDGHTNFRGIVGRMFKINSKEMESVEEVLSYLNSVHKISDVFLDYYHQSSTKVHAEIAVLEHFYQKQLDFAGNDRFIACSKPACFCCKLYFKYHPAQMVVPQSHQKIWTKWSPPRMRKSDKEEMAMQQRQIISKITEDLRKQIIDQILQRSKQYCWHPDSASDYSSHQEDRACSDCEDGGVSISV